MILILMMMVEVMTATEQEHGGSRKLPTTDPDSTALGTPAGSVRRRLPTTDPDPTAPEPGISAESVRKREKREGGRESTRLRGRERVQLVTLLME